MSKHYLTYRNMLRTLLLLAEYGELKRYERICERFV